MAKASPVSVGLSVSIVLAAVAVGLYAASRYDVHGDRGNRLPTAFRHDPGRPTAIDPSRILYRQCATLSVPFRQARGLAVGPGERVHVVGDRSLLVLDQGGKELRRVELPDEPQAVAVAGEGHSVPGRIFVALRTRLVVLAPDCQPLASWAELGPKAVLTSVAVGEEDVVAADAGQRVVYRYDLSGRLLGRIAARDPRQEDSGLIIPGPHCDVAFGPDGLVWVVNAGKHRLEGYTLDGHRETFWGRPGAALEAFCGCCNPVAFAPLADGGVVTAEKGLTRVKVYSAEGTFLGVVANLDGVPAHPARGEEGENRGPPVLDVAATGDCRVLVLHPTAGQIHVYEKKEP